MSRHKGEEVALDADIYIPERASEMPHLGSRRPDQDRQGVSVMAGEEVELKSSETAHLMNNYQQG